MANKIEHDLSTIDMDKLGMLPVLKLDPTYSLQEDPGNCCFLDPPGYPTYFTRDIYTRHGNSPSRGPQKAILGHIVEHSKDWDNCKGWDEYQKKVNNRLRELWKPLPLDHPRTIAWFEAVYKHLNHCYYDKDADESDKTLIYPVPSYKLKFFMDDERFSEEWRIKERASVDQANTEIIANALKVAIPENHMAVRMIRRYYPEHVPDLELIKNPPKYTANWWERLSGRPFPATCPGQYGQPHPVNGSWCQLCGWRDTEQ